MILLLDAANTIIHKPAFYDQFILVLEKHGMKVTRTDLHKAHKLLSEYYHFPDRTSKEFYHDFNRGVLYGLGLIASDMLLEDIFNACSYLPWEKFEDTKYISSLKCQKAVLSNFHGGLNHILGDLFPDQFISLTVSENEKARKPEAVFFERAISTLGVPPSEIIYVGDSIKLDLEPGLKVGMNAWLIDRDNYYPYCKRRLTSLKDIKDLL